MPCAGNIPMRRDNETKPRVAEALPGFNVAHCFPVSPAEADELMRADPLRPSPCRTCLADLVETDVVEQAC
jgi:hypothetical protein